MKQWAGRWRAVYTGSSSRDRRICFEGKGANKQQVVTGGLSAEKKDGSLSATMN